MSPVISDPGSEKFTLSLPSQIRKDALRQECCFRHKASLFGTSGPRLGDLIHQVVDLEKLTYQCVSPIVIRVIPLETLFLHRRHAAAMAAPQLGSVLLIKSVPNTERFSTAV